MSSHREVYSFTWPGKHEALLEAGKPTDKTLRPCVEESLNFYDTQNLYIEGDNLEAMKIIQRAYMKKIKMIYIDPPYNTGHDFIYRDDFAYTIEKEREQYEFTDDIDTRNFTAGNYFENTRNRPRFHSDWCSMMYPRLKIAHNVLADDGVIFISIDDNEQANLRKICDEIFGENNFVAQLVWEKKKKGAFLSSSITNMKEYILVFCQDINKFEGLVGEIDSSVETYPCINAINKRDIRLIPAGIESKYKDKNFFMAKGSEISDTTMKIILKSDMVIKNGILAKPMLIEGNWRYSQSAMTELANKKELYITRDLYIRRIVSDVRNKTLKDLLPRVGDDLNISYDDDVDLMNLHSSGWGSNEDADEELRLLFGIQKIMNYPKPLRLIMKILASYRNTKDSIILDFFSGSATTAHAIMNLNAQDGGHRKFIMIQLPEECAPRSEAAKAGYKNICEIGKERIRRAGWNLSGDTGFRVFKLDSSNYNDVYLTAEEFLERDIDDMIENIKPDRTGMDLLFDYAADIGLSLSLEYEVSKFKGFEIHQYGYDEIIACFDENLDGDTIKYIAKLRPKRAIFFESCFENLMARLNLGQIFRFYAPKAEMIIL